MTPALIRALCPTLGFPDHRAKLDLDCSVLVYEVRKGFLVLLIDAPAARLPVVDQPNLFAYGERVALLHDLIVEFGRLELRVGLAHFVGVGDGLAIDVERNRFDHRRPWPGIDDRYPYHRFVGIALHVEI